MERFPNMDMFQIAHYGSVLPLLLLLEDFARYDFTLRSVSCVDASQNTLQLIDAKDPFPCFVIDDLSHDERFASLPHVNGSHALYRFYAGAPLTTKRGINIGTLFIYDDKPREGLSPEQRKCL